MSKALPQVGVRLAAVDGKVVERELRKFGVEGQAALDRIAKATKPASTGLKAVDSAVGDAKGKVTSFANDLGPLGAGLRAIGPLGAAAAVSIGALVAGFSLAATKSREAAAALADLGDQAKRAAIDVEDFQALKYAADQNRISVDALTDGLKELALRADEFVTTGAGSGAEAFQRLGFEAEDLRDRLKDPLSLFIEIIRRTQELDKAAQVRIGDELFGGTAGERFVELIARGADDFKGLVDEAERFNLIFLKEEVKRAAELDREFRKIETRLETSLTRAFNNSSAAAQGFYSVLTTVADGFNTLIDLASSLENKQTSSLMIRGAEITEELSRLEERSQTMSGKRVQATIKREMARLREEAGRIQDILDRRNGYSEDFVYQPDTGGGTNSIDTKDRTAAEEWRKRILTADQKRAEALREINALEEKGALTVEEAALARTKAEDDYQSLVKKAEIASGARKKEADLLREIARLIEVSKTPAQELEDRLARIAELQSGDAFSQATGGKAAEVAERARVVAMREYLGAAEETAAALERLKEIAESGAGADAFAARIVLAEQNAKRFGETMEKVGDSIADGLGDAIVEGKNFSELMQNLAKQLTKDFLNSQLRGLFGQIFGGRGSSFLGSLVSSLFGGSSVASEVSAVTAGVYHDGGIIGRGGASRSVPETLFRTADRRHSGGYVKPGERAIIALDNERVLTEAMQENTARSLSALASLATRGASSGSAASAAAPTINIYNSSGQDVTAQTSRSADGGLSIDVLIGPIERALAGRVSQGGKLSNAIGKRFALNRANAITG